MSYVYEEIPKVSRKKTFVDNYVESLEYASK